MYLTICHIFLLFQWKKLNMTPFKKLTFVFFIIWHAVVIWILVYLLVLIEGIQGVGQMPLLTNDGLLDQVVGFWKIIIVMCLLAEIAFIVYQSNISVKLFRRLRYFNRIIYVQNAPKTGVKVQQQQQQAVSDICLP